MTSFASLILIASLVSSDPALQPGGFESRVAAEIARSWGVEAAGLHLHWGPAPPGPEPAADAPFRLVGRGSDGTFVVLLDPGTSDPRARSVRASRLETVWVAARPLPAGAHLETPDLRSELRERFGPPMSSRHSAPGPGWELRRPLAAGEPIAWPAAAPPPLVQGGEPVRLVWSRGGVRISVMGRAINSAGAGETVRARVDGTGGRVTATAIEPGVAALAGGER